jgi:hypothetical protein
MLPPDSLRAAWMTSRSKFATASLSFGAGVKDGFWDSRRKAGRSVGSISGVFVNDIARSMMFSSSLTFLGRGV